MKWEYLKFSFTINSQEEFNRLGNDNWELIHMFSKSEHEGVAYFKRSIAVGVEYNYDLEKIAKKIKEDVENNLVHSINAVSSTKVV